MGRSGAAGAGGGPLFRNATPPGSGGNRAGRTILGYSDGQIQVRPPLDAGPGFPGVVAQRLDSTRASNVRDFRRASSGPDGESPASEAISDLLPRGNRATVQQTGANSLLVGVTTQPGSRRATPTEIVNATNNGLRNAARAAGGE